MVSCPQQKKLGSHHSVLTSKKLNKLKKQQLLLDRKRSKVPGQTTSPKIGATNEQIQRITTYRNRNPWAETPLETRARILAWRDAIEEKGINLRPPGFYSAKHPYSTSCPLPAAPPRPCCTVCFTVATKMLHLSSLDCYKRHSLYTQNTYFNYFLQV